MPQLYGVRRPGNHPGGDPNLLRRVGSEDPARRPGARTGRARVAPAFLRPRGQGARPLDGSRGLRIARGVSPRHIHRGSHALLSRSQRERLRRQAAAARGHRELCSLARRRARDAEASRRDPGGSAGGHSISWAWNSRGPSGASIWKPTGDGSVTTSVRSEPVAQ